MITLEEILGCDGNVLRNLIDKKALYYIDDVSFTPQAVQLENPKITMSWQNTKDVVPNLYGQYDENNEESRTIIDETIFVVDVEDVAGKFQLLFLGRARPHKDIPRFVTMAIKKIKED